MANDGEIDIDLELDRLEELTSSDRKLDVVERCSELLERFPDEGRLYYRRALARYGLRDTVAAMEDMTLAQERMSDEPAAAFFYGLWSLENGDYAHGVTALTRAVELEERLGTAYYLTSARFLCGLANVLLGELELARAAMRGLPDTTAFFVAGKLWTLPELHSLLARRGRP